jgi:hypothetical protein
MNQSSNSLFSKKTGKGGPPCCAHESYSPSEAVAAVTGVSAAVIPEVALVVPVAGAAVTDTGAVTVTAAVAVVVSPFASTTVKVTV